MTLTKWLLVIFFVIPIIAACIIFSLAALWMQVREEASEHGKAAELHA